MRAAWLTAGAVVTVIALLISSVLIWRGFARARTPVDTALRSIPFTKDKVRIAAASGQVDLFIVPGQAGELLIQRTLRWSRDRPTVTEDWNAADSTLRLEAVCPRADQPDGPICRAEYVITVPPETDLVAGTTKGVLAVNEAFGSLRLTSVSGDIRLHDVAGSLWARTGTGSIEGERLDGDAADVEAGSGRVHLSFTSPPTSVRAVVRTRGDITVGVPEGAYNVSVDATNSSIGIKRDRESSRKIVATTTDGSVSLFHR
ncbi:DUF4097 family beta strand repeat-containing protein [Nonomuraea turcica]|uniref:DUF4097 family beta strand repeat-containing protein n=1 Tax=Nonomuraea sp. G32 TaxID=3067274 RepID=UPI00273C77D8|nr:DUF4097 family beta strand repeat-containing protein [Nonomuraea sp. G32]MDP4511431.1 DUF4097 family beta strand repeat-containing protein [Nonomuraea sp. G32]